MRSFLLLILSLTTGCEASAEVRGCPGGWVQFTCTYPDTNGQYEIKVSTAKRTITSTKKDMWETNGRLSLYHDTKNKNLRVIKQLTQEDFGDYKSISQRSKSPFETNLELEVEDKSCQKPFDQTAYEAAKTTITCDSTEDDKFFCKEKGDICEEILSTASLMSNGRFNLTVKENSFNLSISNVSSQDAGVYWCGVKSRDPNYSFTYRKIKLEVKNITTFTRSLTAGQNHTYWCAYPKDSTIKKFICKGEDPSVCQRVASTANPSRSTGKFSMIDGKKKRNITITVRDLTTDNTGTYWCGAESTDKRRSNQFFHRFSMIVGRSEAVIAVIICVAVLLMLMLILILIYKRFSHSKNTTNRAAAQHTREDNVYEDIQENLQKPDTGNAMSTIYAHANLYTNPSSSLLYSSISFQKAGGEALMSDPSSSACEYSTLKFI
ncbi:uncharacterized protein LOC121178700 isoform X2 [Toxotes jaculatrix]|uniref:uncharacterized protein LOC121178700 isoform X2 n=1 Tax=Toxotes jaculatrix TaxID=941984 RepID=UPI001B3B0724|nr:uncharacterized protein LOC121178700 isoform X2 [Toxotes jaculatrix]